MKLDNSSIKQKIAVRNKAFDLIPDLYNCKVFEAFAGEMNISRMWANVCRSLISCDIKNKESKYENQIFYKSRWQEVIQNHLDSNIYDFDSYGCILDELTSVSFSKDSLVFFTDGGLARAKAKKQKYDIECILSEFSDEYYFEKSDYANVFYGYFLIK